MRGANVFASIADTVGSLESVEMYKTGLPKLKPLIRLSVTVRLNGSTAMTWSWTSA